MTQKSVGARMGRGKGPIKIYVTRLLKNSILYRFGSKMRLVTISILCKKVQFKLNIKIGYIGNFKGYGFLRKDLIS